MARRQQTEPDLPNADDLPDLTAQQLAFVKGILDGKTATDAYRAAYSTENMLTKTVWAEASRLRSDRKVAAWLSAGRKAHLASAAITLDQHVQRLDELRSLAIEKGNLGAAVAAEQTIGKVRGHHIERYMDMTPESPVKTLEQIAELFGADIAKALAERNGLAWANSEEQRPETIN